MDESAVKVLLASLEASRSTLHWWLELWTLLVVVGVALEVVFVVWEYVEELHDFRRGIVHPPERPIRLLFFLGLLGAALVAIGVAGELYAESKIETVETGIRKANDELFLLLSKEAGDAEKSAKAAHEEADAVKKETDVLTLRLENASRQLGKLEKNIAAQGPRAQLIIKAAPELARKLAPFAGQRVGLFVCGQQGLVDQETLDAWGAIANILGPDTVSGVTGAKWKEVPTNLNFAGNCGAAKGLGQGVGVLVSKRASKSTMEAATVLGNGLAKALPPSPNKMPSLVDPDFARSVVERGFQDKNAPWIAPALDPDLITVVVGEHP